MRLPKLLKVYLGYEIAVTGYNLVQARTPSLPALPLPSVLSKMVASWLSPANTSVAGMNAVTADGATFTLGSDAILTPNKANVITQGKTYPVLQIQGNTYFLDLPNTVVAGG